MKKTKKSVTFYYMLYCRYIPLLLLLYIRVTAYVAEASVKVVVYSWAPI